MSPKTKKFYEFANFRVDVSQKILLRGEELVPLTPKVFDTLEVLLENPGQLVEKEYLMQRLWPDHVVEESNLTSNIKMLRKALGDDAARPRYIETVPRRGYRFISEVREVVEERSPNNGAARPLSTDSPVRRRYLLPAIGALILGLVLVGLWFAKGTRLESSVPVLSAPFGSERLSTDGKVMSAVISPDGKNVVYVEGIGSDKQSVWLRQLESSNNVQIIPPSDDIYFGMGFSPDGNFLYFTRRHQGFEGQADIYRVSIFGGIPTKVVGETQGNLSLSSDGKTISFVRCPYHDDEYCSLWIADAADGKNERKLTSRPRPIRIEDNKISPDGRSVAFAVGQSANAANEFSLMELDLESSAEREMTAAKFFNIRHLAWLPDKSGLLITAARVPNKNFRIWQVLLSSGEVQPLTKDSESYFALSLDNEANRLVSTQVRQDFHLRVLNMEAPDTAARESIVATHVAFAPNGKIIVSSLVSGNDEIWSINSDTTGKQQLTNDPADDLNPVVSPDGHWIFFNSNRTGEAQVWRMNADGSNQVRITTAEGGFPLFVSPDAKWLYYQHGLSRTLWRVSTSGGDERIVLDKKKNRFAFSPDGSHVAFTEKQGEDNSLVITSLADASTVKTLRLPDQGAKLIDLKWTPDGQNLVYVLAANDFENKTLWLQPLRKDSPRRIADLGNEEFSEQGFALAPDGKTFAVVQGGWRHDSVLIRGLR